MRTEINLSNSLRKENKALVYKDPWLFERQGQMLKGRMHLLATGHINHEPNTDHYIFRIIMQRIVEYVVIKMSESI
jgi:hypothetical protein